MLIGITGATGQLGRLAIAALKSRAPDAGIVALVREPAKAADLDLPTRIADYHRPETLAAAFTGLDVLVLISSNDFNDRAGQHRAVITAAEAAGIGRIVYTSILKGHASPLKLAEDHKATETAIAESGLEATILRNGWYTENYTGSLPAAVQAGAVIGCAGEGRLSTAARADYAEAIAIVAADPAHAGEVYELAGDSAYTLAEMADEVSQRLGRPIPYNNLSQQAYAEILGSFGLPPAVASVLADADAKAAEGALFDASRTLSRLIGRPTTPMAQTVAGALA